MVDESMLSTGASSSRPQSTRSSRRIGLMDLPGEVLSQIASELPFAEVIPFLSLNSTLLGLTRANLSPFPSLIRDALDRGRPYPTVLAKLPSLQLFQQDDDDGGMYLPILVRARPRWILERLQIGKWKDKLWKEAFERRFLKSWDRYKMDGDSWRAVFLRLLGRLEHRYLACSHEESWTRFITLHRNGSASLNRIYSRPFDPYEIYDELKHQNNFSSQPTQVRVLLHLQDVRILALGVLYAQPSLFVNPNAHLLLHPPLLRSPTAPEEDVEIHYVPQHRSSSPAVIISKPRASAGATSAATGNEAYFPFVPTMSLGGPPNTAYGLSESSALLNAAAGSSSRRSTFSGFLPRGGRRISHPAPAPSAAVGGATPSGGAALSTSAPSDSILQDMASTSVSRLGAMLTQVRSREDDRPRRWSFGRARSGSSAASGSITISASEIFPELRLSRGNSRSDDLHPVTPPLPAVPERSDTSLPLSPTSPPSAPATRSSLSAAVTTPAPTTVSHLPTPPLTPPTKATPQASVRRAPPAARALEYPRLQKPQPALSHSLYPNYTPDPRDEWAATTHVIPKSDFRRKWEEVDDDFDGALWASGEDAWPEGRRMAEWDREAGTRKRWVGPMIIIAQLFPCDRTDPHPAGSSSDAPVEGPNIDLGPKGMYASLGFEDLDGIMPWVQLRGGGAFSAEAKRPGLGF